MVTIPPIYGEIWDDLLLIYQHYSLPSWDASNTQLVGQDRAFQLSPGWIFSKWSFFHQNWGDKNHRILLIHLDPFGSIWAPLVTFVRAKRRVAGWVGLLGGCWGVAGMMKRIDY